MPKPTLLTTTQAAAELGVSRNRVCQMCRWGLLKHTKLGRDYFISPKDLDAVRDRPKPGPVPTENPKRKRPRK